MRTLRSVAALVVLFGLSSGSCIPLSLPTRGVRGGNAPPALAAKLVVGKEWPNELIADDGTRCITSKERFDRGRIGSEIWCVWTDGGARSPVRAPFQR
jgi:hypothetical protein